MKTLRLFLIIALFGLGFVLSGCEHVHDNYDNTPPSAPRNVTALTGDNRVDLYWDDNPEHDLAGYNVYYSYSYDGKYTLIGSTKNNHFVDADAKNGTTYYYAVAAYDFNGNESDLSQDVVYDTPRPEGFNQSIFDYNTTPNNGGYSFAKYMIVPYNDKEVDFFFENYNGKLYLDVWASEADIQDMGATNDIYDITTAPNGGWIPVKPNDNIKYAEAIPGHTYVVWTIDNHYAKVRIKSVTPQRMVFDWAYQLVAGNKELKRNVASVRQNLPYKVERNY